MDIGFFRSKREGRQCSHKKWPVVTGHDKVADGNVLHIIRRKDVDGLLDHGLLVMLWQMMVCKENQVAIWLIMGERWRLKRSLGFLNLIV